MSQQALQLLIKSHPLWHQIDPRHVPVTVRTIYTVLGRRMNRWHTILASTDEVTIARRTMDAANGSGLFDRLVIAEGRSINQAPADQWQTIECALPYTAFVTGDSFASLLDKIKVKTANINPPQMYIAPETPLIGEKQAFPLLLALSCVLAAIGLNPVGLGIVSAIAFLDMVFLLNDRPIIFERMRFINNVRHWAYALLSGAFLLPLVVDLFHS